MIDITNLRNIGISAHIDSGKTTLSERILFYAGRIHKIQEVRGGEGGATMDHMELERERGITITSAATSVKWQGNTINLIDTPGHVDFTVEVERSLRVLDGAILVLCAVGGVQAQSLTIDRQMRRYGVPRIAFINKMDRTGADPARVTQQICQKLECDAVMIQIPIGREQDFEGVVDLITQEAVYFDGNCGEKVRREPIPESLQDEAATARQHMLEALSMYSDDLMELLLEEQEVPEPLIHKIIHDATLDLQLTPVMMGTAYRNKGIQPLLDAICRYLPNPLESEVIARDVNDESKRIRLEPVPEEPFVGMAFKTVEDPYGSLTFIRIYQGTMEKGGTYYNQRTGRKERFSRIVRMHANDREDIDNAAAGDIVAVLGADAGGADTYAATSGFCSLESIHVPEAVIQMAVSPETRAAADRMAKALQRFRKEDPTFRVTTDEETGETLIAGMGELHLEVYIERMRREYGVAVIVGAPKVSYRESPTQGAKFDIRHKKQTGGSGQFAHIVGSFELLPDDAEETFLFEESITGGAIPRQYIPAVEKGFRSMLEKGPVAGYPVVALKVHLEDGGYHEVDSSEMAFQTAARTAMREAFQKTKPVLLEPVMKMEIECPSEFQGGVVGDINSRRGMITCTETSGASARIEAEIPLSETFGYATDLRSMTQGQGVFSMHFARYKRLPGELERKIIEERKKELAAV